MHVAIVNLTSGGFSGGYRKYLREVMPRLRKQPDVSRLTVLSPESTLPPDENGADARLSWPAADAWQGYRELRAQLVKASPHVVFFPTARLVRTGFPATVMLRNMEPVVVPFAGHTARVATINLARRWVARWSCRNADRVIAVSDFVRDVLVDQWRIDKRRIGVVPHGVSAAPASASTAAVPAALQALVQRARPWLFTAGSIRPARGLGDIVDALSWLEEAGVGATLVVAGTVDRGCEPFYRSLRRLAEERHVHDSIEWVGALDAASMQWAYQQSDAFLMTSRAEACPNIALEAMAAGALCVAADTRPLPEFFGDAASYYTAGAGSQLGARIHDLLHAPDAERKHRRLLAQRRAAGFSWDATARATAAELLACSAGAGGGVPASGRGTG